MKLIPWDHKFSFFLSNNRKLLEMNFSLSSYTYLGSWQIISFGKKILGTVGYALSTCLVDVQQKGQDRKRMIIALSPLALITKKKDGKKENKGK